MTAEKRNANVVVALIGALTVGASVLLWMEPRSQNAGDANRSALLMAETAANGQVAARLSIAYGSLAGNDRSQFDGLIHPDGELEWEARNVNVRVLLIGTGGDKLNQAQTRTMLELVRWLKEQRGLDLQNISLEPSADPRVTPGLPGEAREFTRLLESRELIR